MWPVFGMVAMSFVLREMRPLVPVVLALRAVSMGSGSVRSVRSMRSMVMLATIDRLDCPLHLVNDSPDHTLQAIAILDVSVPTQSIGKTLLLRADLVRQLSHLPSQIVQLGHFGIKVDLVVVVVIVAVMLWLGLAERVKAGHTSVSFDVGDPDGCDLLEPKSEADILDRLAVDSFDIKA